ncbi:hypothetical protein [Rufibacter aurantiacus]|uniref:hypothetical protein n=1 Tax=Rufibacter aurantiacus TaxID=2817374 RepID=UPI001B30FBC8|nr:hypothetical protein [Rufibacter aurantiacus]
MKFKSLLLTGLVTLIGCSTNSPKIEVAAEEVNHEKMIEDYLRAYAIKPTLVYKNDGSKAFTLLNHKIIWKELNSGVEISIDGHSFSTSDKVTFNSVEKSGKDSLNFANSLMQVKVYEKESLIGFVLDFEPCTGTGCSISYQIIYDLKTRKQSYFGKFRTGFEFELYDFNKDGKLDYLATETDGPSADGVLAKEYILYSQAKGGEFEEFSTERQKRFWFRYTSNESGPMPQDEKFEESWVEKIDKSGK